MTEDKHLIKNKRVVEQGRQKGATKVVITSTTPFQW